MPTVPLSWRPSSCFWNTPRTWCTFTMMCTKELKASAISAYLIFGFRDQICVNLSTRTWFLQEILCILDHWGKSEAWRVGGYSSGDAAFGVSLGQTVTSNKHEWINKIPIRTYTQGNRLGKISRKEDPVELDTLWKGIRRWEQKHWY